MNVFLEPVQFVHRHVNRYVTNLSIGILQEFITISKCIMYLCIRLEIVLSITQFSQQTCSLLHDKVQSLKIQSDF